MWVQKGSVKALHCSLLSWPKMCRNLLSSLSSTICVCWPPPAPISPFSLSFSPILSCHSIVYHSLSLSLSGTQAARSFNRLGNGFISSNAVWSEAEPLTLSKRLPTAVMCFHTSQSTRPHRLTIFPHRRPPSLSLARSLFIYFTHSSSSYSQTDSPFPLPPSLSSTPSFSSLLFTSAWGFLFHSGHKALSYRLESAFLSLHPSPHLILHDITVPILPARFNSLFLFLFLYLSLSHYLGARICWDPCWNRRLVWPICELMGEGRAHVQTDHPHHKLPSTNRLF